MGQYMSSGGQVQENCNNLAEQVLFPAKACEIELIILEMELIMLSSFH